MNELLQELTKTERAKIEKHKELSWVKPALATLTDERFSDPDWIFERKLDGERCISYRDQDEVRMMSRNKKKLNVHYPNLEKALMHMGPARYIVDGEIVAFSGNVTSFSRLQQRMHIQDREEALDSDVAVYYYVFDLLNMDGYDVTQLPLQRRKTLLKSAFDYEDPLRYTAHRRKTGQSFFKEACQRGWEGIIAKDSKDPYISGRSRTWLKFKCVKQQEFVIGGYTEPHGDRIGFGALLLGYYAEEKLCYAGKVGTGFDDKTLQWLFQKLHDLEQDTPPFAGNDLPGSDVHWVEPDLVAEIGFEEWTKNNKLRQPRYLGLREDKEAREVRKEEPAG